MNNSHFPNVAFISIFCITFLNDLCWNNNPEMEFYNISTFPFWRINGKLRRASVVQLEILWQERIWNGHLITKLVSFEK